MKNCYSKKHVFRNAAGELRVLTCRLACVKGASWAGRGEPFSCTSHPRPRPYCLYLGNEVVRLNAHKGHVYLSYAVFLALFCFILKR